ncbi:hypothetical protein LINPERPRIM_LOCUS23465 [Linum perenne]
MLLIITITTVTVSQETGCSSDGPVPFGACKDDYGYCVNAVITELRDQTPYSDYQRYGTYYPSDQPNGGVVGSAQCTVGSSFDDCNNCLYAAKDWLDQNCASSQSATYNDQEICIMTYAEI